MSFQVPALPDGERLHAAETLLTRSEAAAYLRSSIPTLERWARLGTGPRYRLVGRKALYDLAELRRFAGVEPEAA